ncbi:methyltransferase domain-containing protein [Streptomyces sp. NPDC057638]|uniref:methyltransferase domain-containing protein n=1 Tax=Streptomyces sp. NPDC057638 TaxID=3346190 RepID=UPI003674EB61
MNVSPAPGALALADAFTTAAAGEVPGSFGALAASVWRDGKATGDALAAVPVLVDALREAPGDRTGYVAVLLGLLAESEYPRLDGPLADAVGGHLETYLELLAARAGQVPLRLALVYLLAHFPARRERIVAAVATTELEEEDRSRLERALAVFDAAAPDLGRVWPAPSAWTLNADERAFDQGWIRELSREQRVAGWEDDTRTVLGCMGARAYWALGHGTPRDLPAAPVPARREVAAPVAGAALFAPHLGALRCPACAGALAGEGGVASCGGCAARYPVAGGILDLTAPVAGGEAGADFLEKLSRVPSMGLFYEAVARPAFLRVSGSNWGGAVTPGDEDAYLAAHVRPVDGPVLDLGAGAGRWTAVLAEAVGAGRLIALDSALPMLTVLRGRLPQVPAVLASAAELPFADASLGAVVCWNALQAFYADAGAAIAEVGRVLRPGGTFTLMTFRRSQDPVYGYFQSAHRFPQHQGGLQLFDPADLRRWLSNAGLVVREESGPGTFVFLTAVREH